MNLIEDGLNSIFNYIQEIKSILLGFSLCLVLFLTLVLRRTHIEEYSDRVCIHDGVYR